MDGHWAYMFQLSLVMDYNNFYQELRNCNLPALENVFYMEYVSTEGHHEKTYLLRNPNKNRDTKHLPVLIANKSLKHE